MVIYDILKALEKEKRKRGYEIDIVVGYWVFKKICFGHLRDEKFTFWSYFFMYFFWLILNLDFDMSFSSISKTL